MTRRCARKPLGWWTSCSEKDTLVTDREPSLSGDNFAEFELYKPGAYAYLGTGNPI